MRLLFDVLLMQRLELSWWEWCNVNLIISEVWGVRRNKSDHRQELTFKHCWSIKYCYNFAGTNILNYYSCLKVFSWVWVLSSRVWSIRETNSWYSWYILTADYCSITLTGDFTRETIIFFLFVVDYSFPILCVY